VFVADRELLGHLYGSFAEVPLFVLDNIEIEPAAEPTAEPTPEATPAE
jgi:hypothetical protein